MELKEETGQVPTWDTKELKKGAKVRGIWTETQTNVGENESNIYILRQDNGEDIGVWGSALLDPRFSRHKIGEEVEIVFEGKVKAKKSNREYNNFKTFFSGVVVLKEESDSETNLENSPEEPPFN